MCGRVCALMCTLPETEIHSCREVPWRLPLCPCSVHCWDVSNWWPGNKPCVSRLEVQSQLLTGRPTGREMQAGFSAATVTATSWEEEASSNLEMKNPRAPALRPARGSRCPQQLLVLRRRWQPRTLRGPGEPVHMLLWRGGAQRLAEDVLFKGQLPGSTRESESSASFPRPLPSLWWRRSEVGMLRCKSACSSLGVTRLSCRLRNPGCSGCSLCKGAWSGSSRRPGASALQCPGEGEL